MLEFLNNYVLPLVVSVPAAFLIVEFADLMQDRKKSRIKNHTKVKTRTLILADNPESAKNYAKRHYIKRWDFVSDERQLLGIKPPYFSLIILDKPYKFDILKERVDYLKHIGVPVQYDSIRRQSVDSTN